MMRVPSVAAMLPFVVLAGCSAVGISNPTVTDPAGEVAIVDSIPSDGRVISDINIVLCQATPADKPHTVDEAMRALKLSARQHGAAGLANVTSGLVTTPTTKCFTMAQAMGIAYK
jgi:hypothetical protein